MGYSTELEKINFPHSLKPHSKLDFYFDVFLPIHKKISGPEFQKEIEAFNRYREQCNGDEGKTEAVFLEAILQKYPEFLEISIKEKAKEDENEFLEVVVIDLKKAFELVRKGKISSAPSVAGIFGVQSLGLIS